MSFSMEEDMDDSLTANEINRLKDSGEYQLMLLIKQELYDWTNMITIKRGKYVAEISRIRRDGILYRIGVSDWGNVSEHKATLANSVKEIMDALRTPIGDRGVFEFSSTRLHRLFIGPSKVYFFLLCRILIFVFFFR